MTPDPYFFIVIFCGVAIIFPLMPLALAWMWRRFFQPPKPGPAKNATYECGVESLGDTRHRFSVRFFLVALFFIIFDIEAVFIYPWAVLFRELGLFGLVEMAVFLTILMLGLFYVWKKGALEWE